MRDRFPRAILTIRGRGEPATTEFTVDTGFDGELALPPWLIQQCELPPPVNRPLVRLADGSFGLAFAHEVLLEWHDELRRTSVLALDGDPLLGIELMAAHGLSAELVEGGEVLIEAL